MADASRTASGTIVIRTVACTPGRRAKAGIATPVALAGALGAAADKSPPIAMVVCAATSPPPGRAAIIWMSCAIC